jgi:sulfite exporter TauE/SafE
MLELPLAFLAGILGSAHCIGMCGPFALAIGSATRRLPVNIVRQLCYSAGRLLTYATFGAAAGHAGQRLLRASWLVGNAQALLALGAGALLCYQGLLASGILGGRRAAPAAHFCVLGSMLSTFLAGPGWWYALVAGMLSGMLPCGLVYALLTLAASSGTIQAGLLIMASFGLGTMPVMIFTGCSVSLMTLSARRHLYRLAACSLMLAGVMSLVRGAGQIQIPGWFEAAGCALCQDKTVFE